MPQRFFSRTRVQAENQGQPANPGSPGKQAIKQIWWNSLDITYNVFSGTLRPCSIGI